ncbi:MAG: tRNA 2-selenouridine(34) synthase MnmH [Nitrosomonas sp.]|nr:MAG: tRNA 2-selenouridine(34) synthase MnmH [Nitrosomonas sp.]
MPESILPATNIQQLFLSDTPFLDVRSESEYGKSGVPNSCNLPILNDRERHLVGTCYKQKGKQAALELGHQLVSGMVKHHRILQWCNLINTHPTTHIFCWRGGMRSRITQQWLQATGIHAPIIEGGYKTLRRFLMQVIDDAAGNLSFIRIAGKTGTAKTPLINQIAPSIDLEKHAAHRGSSFGQTAESQPSQIYFEHSLAIDLLKKTHLFPAKKVLFIEDESRNIGSIAIPGNFYQAMRRSPLVIIDMPLEFRIKRILNVYISNMLIDFQTRHPNQGFELFCNYLQQSLFRIQKRLGLERHRQLQDLLHNALKIQLRTGMIHHHTEWLTLLLTEYYDPMYEYQIAKNNTPVIFRGNYDEIAEWAIRFIAQSN